MKHFGLQLLLVGIAVFGGSCVDNIDGEDLLQPLIALAAVAGVVVTVFGIWVAIIFPRLLATLESGVAPQDAEDASKYRALIGALYSSGFTLCAIMVVTLLLTLYELDEYGLMIASTFCWLALFSVSYSFWSSVISGDGAAVEVINRKAGVGLIGRLRHQGRKGKRKQASDIDGK